MYPPGRLIFVRPIKFRKFKEWDAVWIQPEDIIGAFSCLPAGWQPAHCMPA